MLNRQPAKPTPYVLQFGQISNHVLPGPAELVLGRQALARVRLGVLLVLARVRVGILLLTPLAATNSRHAGIAVRLTFWSKFPNVWFTSRCFASSART